MDRDGFLIAPPGHGPWMLPLPGGNGITRLTVTHAGLEPGSDMLEGITDGWPKVLSSLKTILETGKPLPRLW